MTTRDALLFFPVLFMVMATKLMLNCDRTATKGNTKVSPTKLLREPPTGQIEAHGKQFKAIPPVKISNEEAKMALQKVGKLFKASSSSSSFTSPVYTTPRWMFTNPDYECKLRIDPAGYHHFCEFVDNFDSYPTCQVITYGVSHHHDVEDMLSKHCNVLMLDPTMDLPENIGSNLKFKKLGAPSFHFPIGDPRVLPLSSSINLFNTESKLPVVKMDCEGCEYEIYNDLEKNAPFAFDRITQLALEVHISTKWARSSTDVLNLGKLFALLMKNGLNPVVADVGHCTGNDKNVAFNSAFVEYGYVNTDEIRKHNFGHCQNILFSKLAKPTQKNSLFKPDNCIAVTGDAVILKLQQACLPKTCFELDQRPSQFKRKKSPLLVKQPPPCPAGY